VAQYIFNGDLVDRGDQGVEVFLTCAAFAVLEPGCVIVHRGNHEDASMNRTSGFMSEVFTKYPREEAKLLYERFQSTFLALPLASVVDEKVRRGGVGAGRHGGHRSKRSWGSHGVRLPKQVFVTHAGLSDEVNVGIETLKKIHVQPCLHCSLICSGACDVTSAVLRVCVGCS